MADVHWLAVTMLYVSLFLSLLASVLYVRRGWRELQARKVSSSD
jgi:hypothetical protein